MKLASICIQIANRRQKRKMMPSPPVEKAMLPPTKTGATAPVSVLGRAARNQALMLLAVTEELFILSLPILNGECVVGEEHGPEASTLIVAIASVVVIAITIIIDAHAFTLAVHSLAHILVSILIVERLKTISLPIFSRKRVFGTILHDVERVACGEVIADIVVVRAHTCHLSSHLDAKKEVAQTILTIDDAVVVGVVSPKAIHIALTGNLSEVLSIG